MQNVTQLYSYMVSDLRVRQPWAFEAAVADSCDGGTWAVQAAQGNNTPRRPPPKPLLASRCRHSCSLALNCSRSCISSLQAPMPFLHGDSRRRILNVGMQDMGVMVASRKPAVYAFSAKAMRYTFCPCANKLGLDGAYRLDPATPTLHS